MPFSKGDPNINRAGRPRKGESLTDILREEAEKEIVQAPDGKISAKRGIARKLIQVAMTGDVPAMRYVWDRLDGPIKAGIDLNGLINIQVDGDDADV